jgi:tetratricopeptide (TPR) repeat protein
MLPPSPMLATKKRVCCQSILVFALAITICGCTPAGPRALLKGKRYFDRGDFAAAAEEFKVATTLLETNAAAWNYYGVALQITGQPAEAAAAYERALALNRDMMEAHYNLGCLWLEQNKPDAAKAEFTTYTMRRPNQLDGWLKLGSAQLRSGELAPSERSFSTAYYLNTNSAEALNGLGLARVQRGRPREGSQFFAAAISKKPDFAPAYLNLATVAQEYLHDNQLAVRNYHAYLQLTPHAANASEINVLVNDLNQPIPSAAATAPPPVASAAEPGVAAVPARPSAETPPRPATVARNSSPVRSQPTTPPSTESLDDIPVPPPQVVSVEPAPPIVANSSGQSAAPKSSAPSESQPEAPAQKVGLWHKLSPANWFAGSKKKPEPVPVTPLPGFGTNNPNVFIVPSAPADKSQAVSAERSREYVESAPIKVSHASTPPSFSRYVYQFPAKPQSGNRTAAESAFAKAHDFEDAEHWTEALKYYYQAAQYDPSWFNAQYNTAILSNRLRYYRQALTAFELALAIEPDSIDARYSFGIALKNAGYVTDALKELNEMASASPNDPRAHLALGNIYARQIHDVDLARKHYLKFMELDPTNSQATDIRFWLAANPP